MRDGQRLGVRLRGGVGGNAVEPRVKAPIYWPRNADTGLKDGDGEILSDDS